MRLIERIPIVLEHINWEHFLIYINAIPKNIKIDDSIISNIRTYWTKYPDLRLVQVLINLNIIYDCKYFIEETDYLLDCKYIKPEDILFWGTYGKDGNSPIKYITLNNMDSDHIENCLINQHKISPQYEKIMKKILRIRKLKIIEKYEN